MSPTQLIARTPKITDPTATQPARRGSASGTPSTANAYPSASTPGWDGSHHDLRARRQQHDGHRKCRPSAQVAQRQQHEQPEERVRREHLGRMKT